MIERNTIDRSLLRDAKGIGAANSSLRSPCPRRLLLAGLAIIGICSGLGSPGAVAAGARPRPTPTVDPRLILHPRTVQARTTVGRLGLVSLSLYPAIPGLQRATLLVAHPGKAATATLRADMPGMRMRVALGRLTRHGTSSTFRGRLRLPMFGVYRVRVLVGSLQVASLWIVIPLPPI